MSAPSGESSALEPLPVLGPRKRRKKRKQNNPEEMEIPINADDQQPQNDLLRIGYDNESFVAGEAPLPAAAGNKENQLVREISPNSAQNQLDSSHPAEHFPDEPQAPDNRILGINIHRTDHLLFSIRKIVVKCSVVNEATGRPIQKSTSDRAAVSFYETQRQISFIMPVLTRPFQVEQEMSLLPTWDELIEINEQFEYIVAQNPILIFEVQQCLPENLVTCAWAYLRLRGTVATVDQQIRLQLFSPPKQRDASKMTESCLSLLKGRSLSSSKINSSLHVTICRLTPFDERENGLSSSVNRSMRADQSEARDFDELGALSREQSRISSLSFKNSKTGLAIEIDWARPAGKPCQIPNSRLDFVTIPDFGGFCCRYSPNGQWVAWTSAAPNEHCIIIQSALAPHDGIELQRVPAHAGLIYDLDWAPDSDKIVVCSADRTATVWLFQNKDLSPAPIAVLPAPCYIYSVRFFPQNPDLVFLAGQDGFIYVFSLVQDHPQLIQELSVGKTIINSICFNLNAMVLYATADDGFLYSFPIEQSLLDGNQVEKIKISDEGCNCVAAHPKAAKKAAILSRDGCARIVDVRANRIQPLPGIELRSQLTRLCFSACGSLLFAGSESGSIVCWSTVTNKKVVEILASNLRNTAPCRDVSFHPFHHSLASICYQTKKGLQIWKYDMTKAHLDRSARVDVISSETLKSMPRGPLEPLSRSESSLMGSASALRKSILPPMNTTSNGTVLNDVRAQFEAALTKITANARDDSLDRPLNLADLAASRSSTSRFGSSTRPNERQRDENVAEPQRIEKVQITAHAPVPLRSQPPSISSQAPEFMTPLPVDDSSTSTVNNSQNMRMASPLSTPTKKTRKKKKKSPAEKNETENLPPRPPTIATNALTNIPKSPPTRKKQQAPPPPVSPEKPPEMMMPYPSVKAERPKPMTTNLLDQIRDMN